MERLQGAACTSRSHTHAPGWEDRKGGSAGELEREEKNGQPVQSRTPTSTLSHLLLPTLLAPALASGRRRECLTAPAWKRITCRGGKKAKSTSGSTNTLSDVYSISVYCLSMYCFGRGVTTAQHSQIYY